MSTITTNTKKSLFSVQMKPVKQILFPFSCGSCCTFCMFSLFIQSENRKQEHRKHYFLDKIGSVVMIFMMDIKVFKHTKNKF